MTRLVVEVLQKELRRLLKRAGSGDAALAAATANVARAGGRDASLSWDAGRMVITLPNVFSFMLMEVAMAADAGARLVSCKRCGDVFLIGARTHRRSTAKYCSDKCRVGWNRSLKRGD
jgi:hypothetical protein